MCGLPLRRLEKCNGLLSVEDVCSNTDCLFAISAAEAAADGCREVHSDYANLPDAARLGCTTDGEVIPVDGTLLS